jgi:hypothetical protein
VLDFPYSVKLGINIPLWSRAVKFFERVILVPNKIWQMSLYEMFAQIPDPRRKEGLRVNLAQMFCMIVIANLCGHFGGRATARFAKLYRDTFVSALGLKHPPPSHVTFTDLLNRVPSKALIRAFNGWASNYVALQKGDSISGDGKGLASTVSNMHGKNQDFEAVVSLFSQQSGLVVAVEQYRNAKSGEQDVVRFLIEQLQQMGLTIHLDALHAQKKRLNV